MDFTMEEFLANDGVFEETPAAELAAWRNVFGELQDRWHYLKAQYQLAKELEDDERADRIMGEAQRVSEAGGKVKARIDELGNTL